MFLAPRLSNEHVMCSNRSVQRNEHRRLELFLYIDHWAGVTPLLGVKSQLAFNRTIQSPYNFNSYNNNVKF